VADLDPADESHVDAAAQLLAMSVHESIRGLVPYHATGYARYLKAALEPPPPLRTVLIRLVVVDGVAQGAADWRVLPGTLFLNGIAVTEHARGMGLARRLMADGLAIAHGMGCPRLGLDVVTENSVAMSFYHRLGFVSAGESYWRDVTPNSVDRTESAVQATDWPTFRAHIRAYGFGDLNIRHCDGTPARIRQVGGNVRIDHAATCSEFFAHLPFLGAKRAFTTTPEPETNGYFSRSARMIKE
jgi:ribosomal protein S18 acetylase RimI-like enzyme